MPDNQPSSGSLCNHYKPFSYSFLNFPMATATAMFPDDKIIEIFSMCDDFSKNFDDVWRKNECGYPQKFFAVRPIKVLGANYDTPPWASTALIPTFYRVALPRQEVRPSCPVVRATGSQPLLDTTQ
jgi:hypothetical protein